MSEENTEVAAVPVEEQKRGGNALPKGIGLIGGGAAGYFGSKNPIIRGSIKKSVLGKDASESMTTAVNETLAGKGPDHTAQEEGIKLLEEGIADSKKISAIKIAEDTADKTKLHVTLTSADGKSTKIVKGITNPNTIPAEFLNKEIKDEAKILEAIQHSGANAVTDAKAHLTDLVAKLKNQKTTLEDFKAALADHKKVTDAVITKVKDGEHTLAYKLNGEAKTLTFKNLGKDVKEGAIAVTEIEAHFGDKGTLKGIATELEKDLVQGIKTEGKIGVGKLGHSGKLAIAGWTLGAAVAGMTVFNLLFGGKHTNQVADRSMGQDQQPARA